MTKLLKLSERGQSIWLDHIRRSLITSGGLQSYIDMGIRGLTSNPTIFQKAIEGSTDYDDDLRSLLDAGESVEAIYENLVLSDIINAADILAPVYGSTKGLDGYVSLEVNPALAHDTAGTIQEACRLFDFLDRANILIKVPATAEGIPAIDALIARGVNVNVTLLFSISQYEAVTRAYISGLEKLARSGGALEKAASVASFFVSRVDTALDAVLDRGSELTGKIAIANAKLAYELFKKRFSGKDWEILAGQGARVQRLLWASTGTKNPSYPDTYYVDSLIGRDTVNTVPPATLEAFIDHGKTSPCIEKDLEIARSSIKKLEESGVDLETITRELLEDGVSLFMGSFESIMKSIEARRESLLRK